LKLNSELIFVAKKYFIRESITYFFDKNQLLKQQFLRKLGISSYKKRPDVVLERFSVETIYELIL